MDVDPVTLPDNAHNVFPPNAARDRGRITRFGCLACSATPDARRAHPHVATGHRRATQPVLEVVLYHVGRRQPGTGVGDQNFFRLSGRGQPRGVGTGEGLALPGTAVQKTPALSGKPVGEGVMLGATSPRTGGQERTSYSARLMSARSEEPFWGRGRHQEWREQPRYSTEGQPNGQPT